MTRSFIRLLVVAFLGSCLVPPVILICGALSSRIIIPPDLLVAVDGWTVTAIVATIVLYALFKRYTPQLDAHGRAQASYLNALPARYVNVSIVAAAAVSLLLELAVIRWQGTVFEFFAFYKNFALLCCFAGLGLGYALANEDRVPLGVVIPLMAWQFALLIALRFGLSERQLDAIRALPFHEQLTMGMGRVHDVPRAVAVYFFLSVVFLLTVLTFVPIGQLCGRLMERREKLRAYGLNLLGSLAGVAAMLVLSFLWTPPAVWFAIAFMTILVFSQRTPRALLVGIGSAVVALVVLVWPVGSSWERVYSPYQLLEIGYGERGLMVLRAAGHYYQRVHDLARSNRNVEADSALRSIRDYYELPYHIYGNPKDVAIVGAGTGNDVAAALRSGAAHVDAVEIDPAIVFAGEVGHPEQPYADRRVRTIVDDARSYLRTTHKTYDMVVYGLLDSHTLLSQASNVRLESFVYTVQGLREARARLKPGGVLSLSFSVMSPQLGRKIYLMMQQAFGGRPPVCVEGRYDRSVIFLEAKSRELALPDQLLEDTGFQDLTAMYANPALQADVATDDWPFFYMVQRVYPVSYLVLVGVLLALSFGVTANFQREQPRFSDGAFFLLGAGFMLIETKGITELGLTFGNSWQVIGIVICGILTMAFLANWVVQRLGVRRPLVPYLLLLASLAAGWLIARRGGFPSTALGRLETTIVLTGPMFFSGIVFSTLIAARGRMSAILAANLLGAMLGGLLEYNSLYFGFQFLYLLAMALYLVAFIWELVGREAESAAAAG
jgi:SAM-dependent methyltransferase